MSESEGPDLQPQNVSVPNFSQEALAHLQVYGDAFSLHVQGFVVSTDQQSHQQLREDLQRIRNTLVLLDKAAAVFVVEELLALLDADADNSLANKSELTRVLLQAAEQLSAHFALLQRDSSLESALTLLPLINDSRACRQEALLSDVLVLSAGIELPPTRDVGVTDEHWIAQRSEWVEFATATHADLARRLLEWWRTSDVYTARAVSTCMETFSDFCQNREFLDVLVPLFESAALVAEAISIKELTDGPALRSLYAQLERHVHRCMLVASPDDLLPGDLLRNLLYYVAQSESNSRLAVGLRQRFRLDRVRQASRVNMRYNTPTIGVGYHLALAIRASISAETENLRTWLDQPPETVDLPGLIRLKVRLLQMEPVLTLMGAREALACLNQINAELDTLQEEAESDSGKQLKLAELLLSLDALLGKAARNSVTRTQAKNTDYLKAGDVFVDVAIDTCLREARTGVQWVSDELEVLLAVPVAPDSDFMAEGQAADSDKTAGTVSSSRCHLITQKVQMIDKSLQILPLPEVSPLFAGLSDLLVRLQFMGHKEADGVDHALNHAHIQPAIAKLLICVDYYLGCVMQPQAAAGQLLLDAEENLHTARALLDGNAANMPVNLSEADWEEQVQTLLPPMDVLGGALIAYRLDSSDESIEAVRGALQAFEEAAQSSPAGPVHVLASASTEWFDARRQREAVPNLEEFETLDEIHAVIPQLIDQLLSGSESVNGFGELIERLQRPYDPADDLCLDDDTGGLTLNVDEDLLFSPLDETQESSLDQTLQHVFYHECLSHVEALDESVRNALQPGIDASQRLPTEQMLRALHTLTGSAQTVEAHEIVDIVQPLQRAALARQRMADSFDIPETRYISDLVMALRARLDALITGHSVGNSVKVVEQRLGAFLAASIPGAVTAEELELGGMPANVTSLDDVFSEEADELLERMRQIVHSPEPEEGDIRKALSMLHTLKGSARMAGRAPIAEQAHALESDIQQQPNHAARSATLKEGFVQLSSLLSEAAARRAVTSSRKNNTDSRNNTLATDTMLVSDSAFDTLLDLSTDVTVNQARLSDELARLREVYQDIESTSLRFRELPRNPALQNFPEFHEIVADLEAARGVMRGALRQAEREQQQASRASSGLQQSLIRTRLVRVDEILERLAQTVEDAAESLGKTAQVRLEGGEITLDRALFRQLLAPLEHLARNAVAHGIEPADERLRAGKSSVGELLLSASVDGTDLVLIFADDGRGIQRKALNDLLRSRGQAPLETHEDLHNLLFSSGFSSVESPTALAGHGLGLYAVQAAIEQLGGRIQLATDDGNGTQISLRIPQRIVVNQVVLVENESVLFAFPVAHVDAVRIAGTNSDIPDRYERAALSELMSQNNIGKRLGTLRHRASVLVTAGGVPMAIDVDKVIGYRELVTQALGPQLASLRRFTGGSVLSDGRQVLILDLNRMLEKPDVAETRRLKPARESLRPVALVVDDSLTMRAAAESVLQQCGIASRLARDGVEALDNIAKALPNLILLDLEMPRLHGAAFLKRIQEEYGDACPPVIVISSRDDAENRRKLLEMGVIRFLAKPYTQSQLQEAVEAAGLRLPDLTIA